MFDLALTPAVRELGSPEQHPPANHHPRSPVEGRQATKPANGKAPGHAKCPGASCIRRRTGCYDTVSGMKAPITVLPPSITLRMSVVLPAALPVRTTRSDPLSDALACGSVRTRGWRL